MLDDTAFLQRSRGRAAVALAARGGRTVLRGLHQSGCAKAMLPKVHGPVPEVVFLNTAGGLTGGDRFDLSLDLGPGARVVATTQTAERAYASLSGAADVSVTATLAEAAHLDWLPQETILFQTAALDRRTTIRLGEGASVLMSETLVLGRAAMGETLSRAAVTDHRRIETADGRPLFHEGVGLGDTDLALCDAPAGLDGALALASVVMAGPQAADRLGPARHALGDDPHGAASVANGLLILRMMDGCAFSLRRRLIRVLTELRGAPLPRVWQT